jgi:hypothetical protein
MTGYLNVVYIIKNAVVKEISACTKNNRAMARQCAWLL